MDVKFNACVSQSDITDMAPDALVWATGGAGVTPDISGIDYSKVTLFSDFDPDDMDKFAGNSVTVIRKGAFVGLYI